MRFELANQHDLPIDLLNNIWDHGFNALFKTKSLPAYFYLRYISRFLFRKERFLRAYKVLDFIFNFFFKNIVFHTTLQISPLLKDHLKPGNLQIVN
ncbi:MAG: hypothetical protein JWN78_201 [Bacteroidota bacterium]|nr:hypothetical protein [Bacteroidota bacterium]